MRSLTGRSISDCWAWHSAYQACSCSWLRDMRLTAFHGSVCWWRVTWDMRSALHAAPLCLARVVRVAPVYLAVLLLGVVRTFDGPVRASLLTEIVPEEVFATAVAWLGSIQKTATMVGLCSAAWSTR